MTARAPIIFPRQRNTEGPQKVHWSRWPRRSAKQLRLRLCRLRSRRLGRDFGFAHWNRTTKELRPRLRRLIGQLHLSARLLRSPLNGTASTLTCRRFFLAQTVAWTFYG